MKFIKPYIIVALACMFATVHGYAQYRPLQAFVPAGFSILDTASGDLNRDAYKDMVLILRNDREKESEDTTRPLLLLAGDKTGRYKLMARNDRVVLCKGCGGLFGDPYSGITIRNGSFSIEHYGGSNWRWTRIITFKFNKVKQKFLLRRDAGLSYHTSDPEKATDNIFHKEDFDRLLFEEYDYEKGEK